MKRSMLRRTGALVICSVLSLYIISACSSGDDGLLDPVSGPSAEADCSANGTSSTIENNHGHELDITSADIKAGVSKTYSIQGTADHSHSVTVTPDDFDLLENDSSIEVNSTTGGANDHTHPIIVSCAQS